MSRLTAAVRAESSEHGRAQSKSGIDWAAVRAEFPILDSQRSLDGWTGLELVHERRGQGLAVGIAPVGRYLNGVASSGDKGAATLAVRQDSPLDASGIEKDRVTPAFAIPESARQNITQRQEWRGNFVAGRV